MITSTQMKYTNCLEIAENTSCKTQLLVHCQLHRPWLKCFFSFAYKTNLKRQIAKSFSNFVALDSVSHTSKSPLDTSLAELGTFESVLAHFFLVLWLGPSVSKQIDDRFKINSQGGFYAVPSNCTRRTLLPVGLWTALHKLHETYKDDMHKVGMHPSHYLLEWSSWIIIFVVIGSPS